MKRETLEIEGDNWGQNYTFRVRLGFRDRLEILLGLPCHKTGIREIPARAYPRPEGEFVFVRLEIRFNDLEAF